MLDLLINALQQATLFMPLALGLYMSYRILNITDLTVEGTFVLGAAIYAHCITSNTSSELAILLALLACAAVGIAVALLQKIANIEPLIASILAIFMLYSINFKAMGRPNINLLNAHTLLQQLQNTDPQLAAGLPIIIVAALMLLLIGIMASPLGLLFRTFGDNQLLLKKLGFSSLSILLIGLVFSNVMAGIGGIISAQVNGYADINMGSGVALTAIGSMIIGMQCMRRLHADRYNLILDLIACFLGVSIYFIIVNTLLYFNIDPIYLKLCLGLVLVIFMASSKQKKQDQAYA